MQQNKRTKELDKRLSNLYENRQFYDTLLKYSKCDKAKLRERIQQIDYCINAVELELHRERVLLAK
jgi:hypothetical protein